MALQFGTVDGLVNISERSISCFITAIKSFSELDGPSYARSRNVALGAAFQRFVDKKYYDETAEFEISSITQPVYTSGGKEQSPARMTFCKKMGLLIADESKGIFNLSEIGEGIINGKITTKEYSFILLSKMGLFKDGLYLDNVLNVFASYFQNTPIVNENSLKEYLQSKYGDSKLEKTRLDIILNSMAFCGLLAKFDSNYVISNTDCSKIFIDIHKNCQFITHAVIDDDNNYSQYIGSFNHGVFDYLSMNNAPIYDSLFPNLRNFIKNKMDKSANRQIIFYGAPGTGKSHRIKEIIKEKGIDEKEQVIRTTFHPDSDYSTFVGCYKPIMESVLQTYVVEGKEKPVIDIETNKQSEKKEIVYDYSPQAFIQAYTKAWTNPDKPIILVIEEINRGNCAQIFGDIFQLLDRDENGVSDYEIKPDKALENYLGEFFIDKNSVIPEPIKKGEIMKLPANLFIWATMNTSDQSLFPIDSAFKRRWEWKYMKIICPNRKNEDGTYKTNDNGEKIPFNYKIEGDHNWWDFVQQINSIIDKMTNSADKQLGYFFAKAKEDVISYETFVSKVCFYLWNDIFKTYALDEQQSDLFSYTNENGDKEQLTFPSFYDGDGNVIKKVAEAFIDNVMHWNHENSRA